MEDYTEYPNSNEYPNIVYNEVGMDEDVPIENGGRENNVHMNIPETQIVAEPEYNEQPPILENNQPILENNQQIPVLSEMPENLQHTPEIVQQIPENLQQIPENIQQFPENVQHIAEAEQQIPKDEQQIENNEKNENENVDEQNEINDNEILAETNNVDENKPIKNDSITKQLIVVLERNLDENHIGLSNNVSTIDSQRPTATVLVTVQPDDDDLDGKDNFEMQQEDALAADPTAILDEDRPTDVILGPDVKIDVVPIDVKDIPGSDDEVISLVNRRSTTRRTLTKKNTDEKDTSARNRNKKTNKVPAENSKKSEKKPQKTDNSNKKSAQDDDGTQEKCRICLSEESLTNIFSVVDSGPIANKIMEICTSVKIMKRDFLPQFICYTCLQSLQVAINFKTLCETTDKDLRSKLKRSKNKIRRPTEFVLIDCNEVTESEDDAVNDDEEFHLSNESAISEVESDSDSSFTHSTRRRTRRSTAKQTRKRRRPATTSSSTLRRRAPAQNATVAATTTPTTTTQNTTPSVSSKTRNRKAKSVAVENTKEIALDEEESKIISSDEEFSPPKKRRAAAQRPPPPADDADEIKKEHECLFCNKMLPSLNQLRKHKRTHASEQPFTCHICNRTFKLLGNFNTHLRKHKDEENLVCSECKKEFANKNEQKKHMIEVHGEPGATFPCDKCKRAFTTKARLDRHKDGKCPGYELGPGKKCKPETDSVALGRDLFKSVAPMTSTYWSDSFSE